MKKCSLCGGKLDREKRCTFCGLDNTKNDSMYAKMINRNSCEHEPLTHVHNEPERKPIPAKPAPVRNAKANDYGTPKYSKPAHSSRKVARSSTKKPKGCAALLAVIPFIFAILGFTMSIIEDLSDDWYEEEFYEEEVAPGDSFDYDIYAYVQDTMEENGDYFEMTLPSGIYEVGYHIPKGTYTIELSSNDYGIIQLYDQRNSINYSEFLDWDDVTSVEDMRLFNGAYLVVSGTMEVTLVTENAQPLVEDSVKNPVTNIVDLKSGMVAGEDFEASTYDIVFLPKEDTYAYLTIEVYVEGIEYPFYISYDAGEEPQTFYNVPIPKGAALVMDEEELSGFEMVQLVPSVETSETDLNDFYHAYWY